MPFTPSPVPPSLQGPLCLVEMTKPQAGLIRRAMLALLEQDAACDTLTDDEREEAQAIADVAAEIQPDIINGWCL